MASLMHGTLFLAAHTARSQAYAQAMVNAGLMPEMTLLFGQERGSQPGQGGVKIQNTRRDTSLFLPDLSISLRSTINAHGWQNRALTAESVNDMALVEAVRSYDPDLVIYSGYGAQIVRREMLAGRARFLHMHAGWLPDYRGSTTIYYSWLQENYCGVTAIFLEEQIDTGPMLARKRFSPPPKDIDPDYLYDPAIRADLLIEVLKRHLEDGELNSEPQEGGGNTYYVIHPVLKHLARLRSE